MAKCKNCRNLRRNPIWCAEANDCPYIDLERECESYKRMTQADRIRSMSDEELAEFLCRVKADYQWMNPESCETDQPAWKGQMLRKFLGRMQ